MKTLKNFPTHVGTHCATTSLSEILEFNGYKFSEQLIFGISGSVDFIYLYPSFEECPRLIFTRSPMIEYDFFRNIGIDFKWNKEKVPEFKEIKGYIDNNKPVLALTDPKELEFFGVSTPSLAHHTLTVIGYDEFDKTLKISDMIGSNIFSCSYESFCNAIKVGKPPFYIENIWSPVDEFKLEKNLEEMIIDGMRNNSLKMLQPKTDHSGIDALIKLKNELPQWRNLDNYQFICLHVYLSIEKIGTGGSGFRKLYLEFLKEVPFYTSKINVTDLLNKKVKLVNLYKELSKHFRLESKNKNESYIGTIQTILEDLITAEYDFWDTTLKKIN